MCNTSATETNLLIVAHSQELAQIRNSSSESHRWPLFCCFRRPHILPFGAEIVYFERPVPSYAAPPVGESSPSDSLRHLSTSCAKPFQVPPDPPWPSTSAAMSSPRPEVCCNFCCCDYYCLKCPCCRCKMGDYLACALCMTPCGLLFKFFYDLCGCEACCVC